MTQCEFVVDPPAGGAWNMAMDEALLARAADNPGDPIRLRYYAWSSPTLSLGYFQPLSERKVHSASLRCPVVRRSSGGGAILHDHELTYSLVLPGRRPLTTDPGALYAGVHDAVVAALAGFGVDAKRACNLTETADLVCKSRDVACAPNDETAARSITQCEAFLCFQRLSPHDVLAGDFARSGGASKVCGSAQRRRRNAVMQHGSVLLRRSVAAPEAPGIKELSGVSIARESLIRALNAQLKSQLDWDLTPVDSFEGVVAGELETTLAKYAVPAWTARR